MLLFQILPRQIAIPLSVWVQGIRDLRRGVGGQPRPVFQSGSGGSPGATRPCADLKSTPFDIARQDPPSGGQNKAPPPFENLHIDSPDIAEQCFSVSFEGQGVVLELRGDQTLFEGGIEAGLDLDFSCQTGGCAACRIPLLSGRVYMDEPNALSDEEREAGYILACIAKPRSALRLKR